MNELASLLSTGKTAILLNAVPVAWMHCRRGLHQGDPLSPYLFLIMADLLHQMITSPDNGLRHPLTDDMPCLVIQYADDTLILLRAEVEQVCRLKSILDRFAAATGLHINFHKSTFVPICIGEEETTALAAHIGCPVSSFPQSDLGLPLSTSKVSVATLDAITVKVECSVPG